jgi:peptidoglycan DL-endopeptidase CwlO
MFFAVAAPALAAPAQSDSLGAEVASLDRQTANVRQSWLMAGAIYDSVNARLGAANQSLRAAQDELAAVREKWTDSQGQMIEATAKAYQAERGGRGAAALGVSASESVAMTPLFNSSTPAGTLSAIVASRASESARLMVSLENAKRSVARLATIVSERRASAEQARVARGVIGYELESAKAQSSALKAKATEIQKEQPAAALRQKVLDIAKQYLGTRYVWGGATPAGFDCSGLTLYVYRQVGVDLPHFAASQYGYGSHVDAAHLQPGDLVFFGSPIEHVGIYVGDDKMLDAPNRAYPVRVEPLWPSFSGATRIL